VFIALLSIIAGIALLIWSADKFVIGAASLARSFGMSPLLIGLTIVSIGTSSPEILVSLMAALSDASSLAFGNAIGSNIANIGLVLGITALIAPLPVRSALLYKELPILGAVTVIAGVLLADMTLGQLDGILLLSGLVITLVLFAKYHPVNKDGQIAEQIIEEEEDLIHLSKGWAILWFLVGLVILILSSRLLVWGATEIAQAFGVSELIIGLTIVAIGTSLPEMAASVASALKGHHDIAIGNVIGSNIFNLLAVMAIPGLVAPFDISLNVLVRDFGVMFLFTSILIFLCYRGSKGGSAIIGRVSGFVLTAGYATYLFLLFLQS
jgi:cation:H+ antiporter